MPHRARIFCRKTGMFRSLPAPYTAEFAEHGRTFLVEKSLGPRNAATIPKENHARKIWSDACYEPHGKLRTF